MIAEAQTMSHAVVHRPFLQQIGPECFDVIVRGLCFEFTETGTSLLTFKSDHDHETYMSERRLSQETLQINSACMHGRS